jgi:murein peptide amidase A
MQLRSFLVLVFVVLLSTTGFAQTKKSYGTSRQGRDIFTRTYGTGARQILIIGGVHGNELPSVPLVNNLMKHVRDNPDVILGCTVHFLLEANPDGVAAGTRTNANGVDINRNMEYDWSPVASSVLTNPGPFPYSEPETVALEKIITNVKPQRILSVHAYANILDYDTTGGNILAQLMSKDNGMLVATIGYPTPGSLGRYCTFFNIPLITLELPGGLTDSAMFTWQLPALIRFMRADI